MHLYSSEHTSANAVDGNTEGVPFVQHYNVDYRAPWLVIDLQNSYKILGVRIYFIPDLGFRVFGYKVSGNFLEDSFFTGELTLTLETPSFSHTLERSTTHLTGSYSL